MKKTIFPGLLLLVAILLSACGAAPQAAEAPAEPLLPAIETQAPLPTATPIEPAPEPIPGGFPSAAFAAREALAELLGISAETIEIRNIEPAEWPDGCLGLAGPDEMCTMAIVPGYRITLVSDASQYVYRTDERGASLRREVGVFFAAPGEAVRPLATWQNPECTEAASLSPEGLSFGACGGPYIIFPWAEGVLPATMLEFLETFAPFEAETPAGKILFKGTGTETAALAEQRAIAEWMKIQALVAQSGRPQADWGLALTYSRQGGFAGFCDEMKVYLDGSVLLSSCKNVDIDYRLDAEQLEQLYAWYDGLATIDYSYTDPGTADAMSIKLAMPAQGVQAADEAAINEILAFCAALIQQARSNP